MDRGSVREEKDPAPREVRNDTTTHSFLIIAYAVAVAMHIMICWSHLGGHFEAVLEVWGGERSNYW